MQTFLSPYDIATKKKKKKIQNHTLTLHTGRVDSFGHRKQTREIFQLGYIGTYHLKSLFFQSKLLETNGNENIFRSTVN